MRNTFKRKLAAGDLVTVVNPSYPSPGLVETLAKLGFDAAFVDCEKYSHTIERVEEMARAGRAGGCATLVRPWSNDPGLISRYLDVGADGIIAPSIENADAARRLVESVRFARHHDFSEKVVCCIVESPSALNDLPAMLKVDEVDVWIIGVNDLAHNMGFPGKAGEPAVQNTVRAAIKTIVGSGRTCGMLVTETTMPDMLGLGVRCLLSSVDLLLKRGANEFTDLLARNRP